MITNTAGKTYSRLGHRRSSRFLPTIAQTIDTFLTRSFADLFFNQFSISTITTSFLVKPHFNALVFFSTRKSCPPVYPGGVYTIGGVHKHRATRVSEKKNSLPANARISFKTFEYTKNVWEKSPKTEARIKSKIGGV